MSNVGPVCHIPPVSTPGNPQPTNLPGIPGPASPNDPVSMANLLNAMRLALLSMLNQLNSSTNNNSNGLNRKPEPTKAQWNETNRVTSNVKIYQNNDPNTGNFVEVEQINQLTMTDKSTGNTWVWKRNG